MAADRSGMIFAHIVGDNTTEMDFDEAQELLMAETDLDEADTFSELETAFWAVFANGDGNPSVGWEDESGVLHVLSPLRYDTEGF